MFKFRTKVIFRRGKIIIPVNADVYRLLRTEKLLNHEAFSYVIDGAVLRWLYYILSGKNLVDNSGSVLIYDFLGSSNDNEQRILVIGGDKDTKIALQKRFTKTSSSNTYLTVMTDYLQISELHRFARSIDICKYDKILVALGCPKQEILLKFLHIEGANQKFCGLACGGALDMYVGKIKRCPPIISKLGLEGIYRFIKEPSVMRLKRLATSVYGCVLFTYDFINDRIALEE